MAYAVNCAPKRKAKEEAQVWYWREHQQIGEAVRCSSWPEFMQETVVEMVEPARWQKRGGDEDAARQLMEFAMAAYQDGLHRSGLKPEEFLAAFGKFLDSHHSPPPGETDVCVGIDTGRP